MTDDRLAEHRREQARQMLNRRAAELRREYWKRKEWKWEEGIAP